MSGLSDGFSFRNKTYPIPYYIIEYKKFKNKNEEENSVQSRLSRHVAEFW